MLLEKDFKVNLQPNRNLTFRPDASKEMVKKSFGVIESNATSRSLSRALSGTCTTK